jgi:pseudouridine-5'-phosphate glycosidase
MPEAPAPAPRVALETTLLVHGVPREAALPLARNLFDIIRAAGAEPALIGVIKGRARIGMSEDELKLLLDRPGVPKLNAANLGLALAGRTGGFGATTVSATLELSAAAGIRVLATGGLGGVHRAEGGEGGLDVSSDLIALTRYPVAVVCSGVKSILDVHATREMLETLGVPVVGVQTHDFPAFYLRRTDPPIGVDGSFNDETDLAPFVRAELVRSGRGIVIANPIPALEEIPPADFNRWLALASAHAATAGISGRDITPFILSRLHELSRGATLQANLALVKDNAALAARLAKALETPSS